jgi:hypothetical protein
VSTAGPPLSYALGLEILEAAGPNATLRRGDGSELEVPSRSREGGASQVRAVAEGAGLTVGFAAGAVTLK